MAKSQPAKPAKYADKSEGQPGLTNIFKLLKGIVSQYAKGDYFVKADRPGQYELYYGKEVIQEGRVYPEMPFAALLIQKGYVGFYFYTSYISESLHLFPDLMKTLKGKTCFHIKKEDPELFRQIALALKTGYTVNAARSKPDA